MRLRIALAWWVIGALCLAGCGRESSSADTSPGASAGATPSNSASPSASTWAVYSDSTYHFTVSYPPGFTFQVQGSGSGGLVQLYRAVDTKYLSGYPPGEIDIGIYTRDSDSLAGWVTKHSGPSSSTDVSRYWTPVTNQKPATVGAAQGLAFDWMPDTMDITNHATITFLGQSHVLLIQWWSTTSSYESELSNDYTLMVTTAQV